MKIKLIEEKNPAKYLSVKLPIIGAFLVGLLPVLIEKSMSTQLIPNEYHIVMVSVVLPTLTYLGRIIHQPELHLNLNDGGKNEQETN